MFKGKWYNIKQLIGIAKEAKLKNSAPIKYHIEIANSFWNNIFKVEGITDRVKQQERVNQEKDNIITGNLYFLWPISVLSVFRIHFDYKFDLLRRKAQQIRILKIFNP